MEHMNSFLLSYQNQSLTIINTTNELGFLDELWSNYVIHNKSLNIGKHHTYQVLFLDSNYLVRTLDPFLYDGILCKVIKRVGFDYIIEPTKLYNDIINNNLRMYRNDKLYSVCREINDPKLRLRYFINNWNL